jgi:hypothetical protein
LLNIAGLKDELAEAIAGSELLNERWSTVKEVV